MVINNKIAVIGAGGHAGVVISAILEAGLEIGGIFDDNPTRHGTEILGHKVLGSPEIISDLGFQKAIIAIGDNRTRYQVAQRFPNLCWQTIVHPRSYLHHNVKIGVGSIVMVNAVIRLNAIIGDHVIVNTGAVVEHECVVESYAHIAGSVHLGGECYIHEGAFMGLGVVAVPGTCVGAWSIVGAGATVTKNISSYTLAVGVPAKPKKSLSGSA